MQKSRCSGGLVSAIAIAALSLVLFVPKSEAQPCPGDCDGNGSVSIAELIRGVNIALGLQDISVCSAFDINNDGMVRIN